MSVRFQKYQMSVFDRLNRHKYLYLVEITEPADNMLKLKLAEAAAAPAEDTSINGIKLKASELTVTADCAIYEVIFNNYIAYSVRNEAYTTRDEEEEFEGRLFCTYTRSKFLDYVQTATFASDQFPGPWKHFGFNCLNHIIDAASMEAPEIVDLQPALDDEI
jgi:hypothetical protein